MATLISLTQIWPTLLNSHILKTPLGCKN